MKKSVNKNNKTSRSKARLSLTPTRLVVIILGIAVLLPLVVYGYNKWLDVKDYEKFQTLKMNTEVVNKTLQDADKNIVWKIGYSCVRAHVVWENGATRCSTGTVADITLVDPSKARGHIDLYNLSLDTSTQLVHAPNENDRTYPDATVTGDYALTNKNRYSSRSYTDKATSAPCTITYKLETSKNDDQKFILNVSFNCTDNSRNTWFPRSDI